MVPTILTIFGVTGDLSYKKLFPALIHLYMNGYLPSRIHIIGVGRRAWNDEDLRAYVSDALTAKGHHHPQEIIDQFLALFEYRQGDFDEREMYTRLGESIEKTEKIFGTCTNKLFYFAVPPHYYEMIARHVHDAGLSKPCADDTGWARILVEKPFGEDTKSAQELDTLLGSLFKENQIYRIDHYLAKEALQNILAFRFSNTLYESIWDAQSIERVEIIFHEKDGVGTRGNFYDKTGALRDVGQNHVLQMVALIAMDRPDSLEANDIRTKREEVLASIIPITEYARAQYEGYTKEPGVEPYSQTETFFRLILELRSKRWAGVPFILESGKGMDRSYVEITIYFRETSCLCPADSNHVPHRNTLTFRIQPDEAIRSVFWIKRPGFLFELQKQELSFEYAQSKEELTIPDAYERILFDCIAGDQTLFLSTREVLLAWQVITPIIEQWKSDTLLKYERGSAGPLIKSNSNTV